MRRTEWEELNDTNQMRRTERDKCRYSYRLPKQSNATEYPSRLGLLWQIGSRILIAKKSNWMSLQVAAFICLLCSEIGSRRFTSSSSVIYLIWPKQNQNQIINRNSNSNDGNARFISQSVKFTLVQSLWIPKSLDHQYDLASEGVCLFCLYRTRRRPEVECVH